MPVRSGTHSPDLRRLLGWSAISQTGYRLMAVAALGRTGLAVPALFYFLVAYAWRCTGQ